MAAPMAGMERGVAVQSKPPLREKNLGTNPSVIIPIKGRKDRA